MNYRQEIGALLKELRKEKGLSQAALSEKSGLHEMVIKRIESPTYSETSTIKIETLFKICKALEVEPETFINPLWNKWKK